MEERIQKHRAKKWLPRILLTACALIIVDAQSATCLIQADETGNCPAGTVIEPNANGDSFTYAAPLDTGLYMWGNACGSVLTHTPNIYNVDPAYSTPLQACGGAPFGAHPYTKQCTASHVGTYYVCTGYANPRSGTSVGPVYECPTGHRFSLTWWSANRTNWNGDPSTVNTNGQNGHVNGPCERPIACRATGTRCVCVAPKAINPDTGQCELQETYTLTLTPDKDTIEPNQSANFTATVTKNGGGVPDKPIPVSVSVSVDPISGGHDHGDGTRPRGGIGGTKCESDATCKTVSIPAGSSSATFDFNATDAAGMHTVTASCDKCTNGAQSAEVTVKVAGLIEIPGSQFYTLYESDGTNAGSKKGVHESNHWLTPAAAQKLLILAINYQTQTKFRVFDPKNNMLETPSAFRVNDASLEWGGKFDLSKKWQGNHYEHMRGVSVDLRANEGTSFAIPPENFPKFEKLLDSVITKGKEKYILECTGDEEDGPQHDRVAENNCVSVLDGSFDNNRHYHIRLMGVK